MKLSEIAKNHAKSRYGYAVGANDWFDTQMGTGRPLPDSQRVIACWFNGYPEKQLMELFDTVPKSGYSRFGELFGHWVELRLEDFYSVIRISEIHPDKLLSYCRSRGLEILGENGIATLIWCPSGVYLADLKPSDLFRS